MLSKVIILAVFALFLSKSLASTCNNAEVSSTSFTTQDATIVSQIAFIAEFSLKCSNSGGESLSLFAEIDGRLMPVARVGDNKFQVSWSEEIKVAKSGEHVIRLFDEEGFGVARKAQRSGEDVTAVKSLAKLSVRHPGAFSGPWINSEILAALISLTVGYVAFATRSKILS